MMLGSKLLIVARSVRESVTKAPWFIKHLMRAGDLPPLRGQKQKSQPSFKK